jgi:hypothetical protein
MGQAQNSDRSADGPSQVPGDTSLGRPQHPSINLLVGVAGRESTDFDELVVIGAVRAEMEPAEPVAPPTLAVGRPRNEEVK